MAVVAAYRELMVPANTASGIVFLWPLNAEPRPGLRIVLPGGDGRPHFGVVIRKATREEVEFSKPSSPWYAVIRLATEAELMEARAEHAADSERFWAQARLAAGMERGRRVSVIGRFPELYPTGGTATPSEASVYERGWRRVWKRAENEHRPDDELQAYEAIARRWGAVHRQSGNA